MKFNHNGQHVHGSPALSIRANNKLIKFWQKSKLITASSMFLTFKLHSTLTLILARLIIAACFIRWRIHNMHNDCCLHWYNITCTFIIPVADYKISHRLHLNIFPLLIIIKSSSWENINLAFQQFLLSDTVRCHGSGRFQCLFDKISVCSH